MVLGFVQVRFKIYKGRLYRRFKATEAPNITNPTSYEFDDYGGGRGHKLIEEMLLLATYLYNLPNMDFLVHWADAAAPGYPVIGNSLDVLNPKGGFGMQYTNHWDGANALSLPQSLGFSACIRQRYPRVRKEVIPKVIWRGSNGDPYHHPAHAGNFLHFARVQLHALGLMYPDTLDTRVTKVIQHVFNDDELKAMQKMLGVDEPGVFIPSEEYQKYAVVLDIDGNSWSSRLWELLQGSVAPILKQASRYAAWYEHIFAPGLHLYQFDPQLRDLPLAAAALLDKAVAQANTSSSSGVVFGKRKGPPTAPRIAPPPAAAAPPAGGGGGEGGGGEEAEKSSGGSSNPQQANDPTTTSSSSSRNKGSGSGSKDKANYKLVADADSTSSVNSSKSLGLDGSGSNDGLTKEELEMLEVVDELYPDRRLLLQHELEQQQQREKQQQQQDHQQQQEQHREREQQRRGGLRGSQQQQLDPGQLVQGEEQQKLQQQQEPEQGANFKRQQGIWEGKPDAEDKGVEQQEKQQQQQERETQHVIVERRHLLELEAQPTLGSLNPTQRSSSELLTWSGAEQLLSESQMLLQGLEAQALNRQLVAAVVLNKWSMIEALAYTLQQYSERVVGWEVGREEGEYELVPFGRCCVDGSLPRELKEAMAAAD